MKRKGCIGLLLVNGALLLLVHHLEHPHLGPACLLLPNPL